MKRNSFFEKTEKNIVLKIMCEKYLKGSTDRCIFLDLFPIKTGLSSSDITIVSVKILIVLKYASRSSRVRYRIDTKAKEKE